MDLDGSIFPKCKNTKVRNPIHLKEIFDQYCDEFLELQNCNEYKNHDGTLNYGYFLRIYKTAFFWKKIRFEDRSQAFLYKRRGFLHDNNFDMYK